MDVWINTIDSQIVLGVAAIAVVILLQRSQIDNERGRIEDKSDNGADQL